MKKLLQSGLKISKILKQKRIQERKLLDLLFYGEEELATILRAGLGKVGFNKRTTDVTVDTSLLFKEDFSELRDMFMGKHSAPFIILTGVETDEEDDSKQYQKVWNKGFLPGKFNQYLKNGFKFR